MIVLKSREEIGILREANRIVAQAMEAVRELISDGVTTADLDRKAEEVIRKAGAEPAFPKVPGYRHTLCVSINEEVVHGIPGKRRLKEGDIVSVDCGVVFNGFVGDHAWTWPVGKVSADAATILKTGEKALELGIGQCRSGNRLHDISHAIQMCAEGEGFSVVRDYVGHGIGRELHEDPQVPNFGEPGTGLKLRAGLVLALEPMLNAGTHEVETLKDGWTVVTKDRKLSVHFEHSVAITDDGPQVLSVL